MRNQFARHGEAPGVLEAGPLVRREPAGEPDRQDLRFEGRFEGIQDARRFSVARELVAQPAAGEDRQLELLALVRLPQLTRREVVEPLPELAAFAFCVEVVEIRPQAAGQRLAHRVPDPAGHVDAVRDADDFSRRDAAPGRVGGPGMELADGVCPRCQSQTERGHVEFVRVGLDADPEFEDLLHRDTARRRAAVAIEERARDAPHEIGGEPFVARCDGSVDREDAVGSDAIPGLVERIAGGDELAGTFRQQERGVAFVEMPDRRFDPERPDRPDAPDPQHQLLVEAHLAAPDVEDVGDRPIRVAVLGDVRIEQEDRRPPT